MSSDQSLLISHINGKFYVCSKFSDVVFKLHYGKLRYVTDRHVWINGMLRYFAVSYITLHYVRVENRHKTDNTYLHTQTNRLESHLHTDTNMCTTRRSTMPLSSSLPNILTYQPLPVCLYIYIHSRASWPRLRCLPSFFFLCFNKTLWVSVNTSLYF